VDARLIEAPFEVAVRQGPSLPPDAKEPERSGAPHASRDNAPSGDASSHREQKRRQKAAERLAQREAKLSAQQRAAELKAAAKAEKQSSRTHKRKPDSSAQVSVEDPTAAFDAVFGASAHPSAEKADMPEPIRRATSFDELMGHSGE